MSEIKSGKISDETIARIKRGKELMRQQSADVSFLKPQSKADELATKLKEMDRSFPSQVASITEFPCRSFTEIVAGVKNGSLLVERFSFAYEIELFELMTSQNAARLLSLSMFATFLVPLISVILAVVSSAWFLLGLLYFLIGKAITKGIYSSHIVAAALESENKFCILYHSLQICVRSPQTGKIWSQEPTWNSTPVSPPVTPSSSVQSPLKTSVGILIPGDTTLDDRTIQILSFVRRAITEQEMGSLDKMSFPCSKQLDPAKPSEPWGRIVNCELHLAPDGALSYLAHTLRRAGASPDTTLIITRNGKDDEMRIDQVA